MKQSRGDVAFDAVNYSLVTVALLVVAYPLYFIILASFSDPFAVNRGEVLLWPKGANVLAYKEVFRARQIWVGYGNTFFYAAAGSCIAVAVTLGAAFALSRKELVGRGLFAAAIVFTLIFSGGLIPLFLLVKDLGLYNSRLYILIHSATTAWWIMISRTFFLQLPDELYDSARIDGCSDLQFFFRIVLGTSSALIAVLFLLAIVTQWNGYFVALVFLQDKSKFPLQVVLPGDPRAAADERLRIAVRRRRRVVRGCAQEGGADQVRDSGRGEHTGADLLSVHSTLLRKGGDDRFAQGIVRRRASQ